MIICFSPETIREIGHYVYRLVDPRNGQTFYVGEGQGNRVFAHVNAVDPEAFYKSSDATEQDKRTEDNIDPAKIVRIRDIKNSGLDVIHIIQRWGMDQKTAFEVESAFIDFFGLSGLTNKVKGHHKNKGMATADEIDRIFTAKEFEDYSPDKPDYPKFILIKIKDSIINERGGNNIEGIYKTVRSHWKLRAYKANKYPYVLAVRYGIVEGVFKVNEEGWKTRKEDGRIFFDGTRAEDKVWDMFYHKKIPARFAKRQNPASYCD